MAAPPPGFEPLPTPTLPHAFDDNYFTDDDDDAISSDVEAEFDPDFDPDHEDSDSENIEDEMFDDFLADEVPESPAYSSESEDEPMYDYGSDSSGYDSDMYARASPKD